MLVVTPGVYFCQQQEKGTQEEATSLVGQKSPTFHIIIGHSSRQSKSNHDILEITWIDLP